MFWYPALVIALLIFFFIFCIVLVAHAGDIETRKWGVGQEWQPKEHRSIKVPGTAMKLTPDQYRMAVAEKEAVIINQ